MQTRFSTEQLADPRIAEAEKIIRKCVHCGFCTATCPTYVTLGNELDSPRGRIYLIKDMLENGRAADAEVALHVDRCLSCLACTTTCPSGVDYMHLIDQARVHVEETYRRPLADRFIRALLARVLPYPGRFRLAVRMATLARPFSGLFSRIAGLKPLSAMLALAPQALPRRLDQPKNGLFPAQTARRGRVAVLAGCAQSVLDPEINRSAIALLTRLGIDVVMPRGEGCCGALTHHMGREEEAKAHARRIIDGWMAEIEGEGLDAIVITTSGCGTVIKDYGHLFRDDPAYGEKAARVAALARDVTEYLATLELPDLKANGVSVAYHAACSLQHGQKITLQPKALLRKAGFAVREPAEGHLCCGSAGTYNILQPEIASRLRDRKADNIRATKAQIIAAGNIGCMTQLAGALDVPILHTVQLLDWAYGGEHPSFLNEKSIMLKPVEVPAT
ncbi:glycolate oxidase subunit GlcF [Gellertiella hungarica]|uniref:Glycolate oxidase iron-sulfur subunit n=1 Tax=Gellertiella hungarica TaxID=1572859 RepID=A0A7W6NJD7_9HYPH|nr:glycolate oxidase subunit GlcF [Gellertiella hungarica]MBB4064280.1 glycolate oxidase iron-sulfur subunit [Gellertiella hungarica]